MLKYSLKNETSVNLRNTESKNQIYSNIEFFTQN